MPALLKHLVTLSLAVAACTRATLAIVQAAPPPPPLSHQAAAPRAQADRDSDFALAWTTWTSGKRADATTMFAKLVRELHSLATAAKPFTVLPGARGNSSLAVSSDGTRGVAQLREGVYWFDGSGTPLRFDALKATSVAFVPGTSLAVLTDPDLTIVDATTFDRVLSVPHVMDAKASPSGKLLVYVVYDNKNATFHVWDVATKRELRAFALRPGESWQLFSIGFSPDEKELYFELSTAAVEDELGNAMSGGEYHVVLIDAAGARLDFPAREGHTEPSFSSDGKYIAYAYSTYTEGKGFAGKTILIDRATRKQIVSSAVGFPTDTHFSNNGKYLLVGALRKVHVLSVPSMHMIATTPELRARSRYGGDDMQDIWNIQMIGADRGFSASTADGTTAAFRLPSAKLVWKGPEGTPAERVPSPSGAAFTVDGALVTVDDNFAVTHRPLTPAELDSHAADPSDALGAQLESTVCTIGDRIIPIAACH